ncbi:MAG TPA: GntR family transcriptional regulator [Chthonomonadaceae bacterium]|nr:GntR family transcriptional regulator [Chthonomonadaceae bacterium]
MYTPHWKKIADSIRADISAGKLSTGEALLSETELAEQWKVSRGTAHRAMHELQRSGLVVRKRRAGTFVAESRKPRLGQIAVLIHTGDFLEQEYLSGIRAGLPDEYDLLFCNVHCDYTREAQTLERLAASTDGILCIPTCDPHNTDQLNALIESGTRIVFLDCMPDGVDADAVLSDNYGGTREALQFLVARGHRRIAHFTVNRMAISSLRERYDAYREVMIEQGATDIYRWVREFPYDVTTRDPVHPSQAIQDALFTLMHSPERPTAIFCAHDYILSAVLQACQTLGLAVPEDLEIVSFNDCPPFVPYLPGNVHRIVQRAHEMGQIAAERLHRRLRGETDPPEIARLAPLFYAAGEAPDRNGGSGKP